MPLRLVLTLHNHQPVGNLTEIFDRVYSECYNPFLETLESFPQIPVCLHFSGSLLEWLVAKRPGYVERLAAMVQRGQVEILGGAFYEPVLPMIPTWDRLGQIADYKAYLEEVFNTKVRGMWLPERVWEKQLVEPITQAGLHYAIVDDYHFYQAGAKFDHLFGVFQTEHDGQTLKLLPGNEQVRVLVPRQEPQATIDFLESVHRQCPDAVVVLADDGEKFGSWPLSHDHCYKNGWLKRFFEALVGAPSWLHLRTPSQIIDQSEPLGRIFLPDSSYREMSAWVLPPDQFVAYYQFVGQLNQQRLSPQVKRFVHGGNWHNFRVKYPEVNEMYARMVQVSRQIRDAADQLRAEILREARRELYQAQCNCAYWHGIFGGLYQPHLRYAVFHHLINAENIVLRHGYHFRNPSLVEAIVDDFDLDGTDEVCLNSTKLAAFFAPQRGGCCYELDARTASINLLATLTRQPEPYHAAVKQKVPLQPLANGLGSTQLDDSAAKPPAVDARDLVYDRYQRNSLVDHFLDAKLTASELANGREDEYGDFVDADYEHRVENEQVGATLVMSRFGRVGRQSIRLTKSIRLQPVENQLVVRYKLENLPAEGLPCHFAPEFNFSGFAAPAFGNYFTVGSEPYVGDLNTLKDLEKADSIGLTSEWLGVTASLQLSRPGGIWAYPVQSVNQGDDGVELVYQGTVVIPHWEVLADQQGAWEVEISLRIDSTRAEQQSTTQQQQHDSVVLDWS